jgi:hypothetical protein
VVKVAAMWDVWLPIKAQQYDVHWRFMLKHFGVDQMAMTPWTGVVEQLPLDHTDTELVEMRNLDEIISCNPDLVPVVVDENGRTPLDAFKHPANALYIFGRTGRSAMEELHWEGDSVRIEGVSAAKGVGLLHPNQACALVLYDRLVKSWQ